MRKEETREIDGVMYTCAQFQLKKSLRVLTRLGKRVGGPIASVFDAMEPGKDMLNQDLGKLDLGKALEGLFHDMGDDELYDLTRDICSDVIAKQEGGKIGGQLKDSTFDQHFVGRDSVIRLLKVCKFALEVNYGDFLSAAVGAAGIRREVQSEGSSTRVR